MCQLNVTLCRHQSLREVLISSSRVSEGEREAYLSSFEDRIQLFWEQEDCKPMNEHCDEDIIENSINSNLQKDMEALQLVSEWTSKRKVDSKDSKSKSFVPADLVPASIISNSVNDVVIVSFDTRHGINCV